VTNDPGRGASLPTRRASFPTTHITLIRIAGDEASPLAHDALARLCHAYWYPIYAYVRRLGYHAEEAEDLTQGFFTRVLEKRYLRDFDRSRGRFRSFLLTSLKHFIANERAAARAWKRGGRSATLSLDDVLANAEPRYRLEPHTDVTPDKLFERQWALAVLARAQDQLRDEAAGQGKTEQFERLKGMLVGEDLEDGYRAVAAELGTTAGALKVAVHRWRQRFREILREEIAHTVSDAGDVGSELRELLAAIRL
jgi:RNA polymerase sigma-70 factor (ECF subfamily)